MSYTHPMDLLLQWRDAEPRPDPLAMVAEKAGPGVTAELDRLAAQIVPTSVAQCRLSDAWRVLQAAQQWVELQPWGPYRPSVDGATLAVVWVQTEFMRLGGVGVHAAFRGVQDVVALPLLVAVRDFLGAARAQTQFAELRLEVAVTTRTMEAHCVPLWNVGDGLTRDLAMRIAAEQLALARTGRPYDDALFLSAALTAASSTC